MLPPSLPAVASFSHQDPSVSVSLGYPYPSRSTEPRRSRSDPAICAPFQIDPAQRKIWEQVTMATPSQPQLFRCMGRDERCRLMYSPGRSWSCLEEKAWATWRLQRGLWGAGELEILSYVALHSVMREAFSDPLCFKTLLEKLSKIWGFF